ncbi:hypothetical protein [Aeromonas veronii]|uniref:hypothetical protein n=1 Tax=Aeromonas veronii TaxID=654 RepID=UPI003BA20548
MVDSHVDLGGPAPEPSPQGQPLNPAQRVTAPNMYANAVLDEKRMMYLEKMWMRVITFVVVMGLAVFFLCKGLVLANEIGFGVIENQKKLVKALVAPVPKVEPLTNSNSQLNTSDAAPLTLPMSASNPTAVRSEVTNAKPEVASTRNSLLTLAEHQNWLSAGSLLTLVAFILGVGLTLLLTLIRNVFRAQEEESQRQTGEISRDIATPLSCLIEDFIAYMRKKFSS